MQISWHRMLILRPIFSFSPVVINICFLVSLAKKYMKHNFVLGPIQQLFLTFQSIRHKAFPLGWQLWLCFKVALFIFFFFYTIYTAPISKIKHQHIQETPPYPLPVTTFSRAISNLIDKSWITSVHFYILIIGMIQYVLLCT